MTSIDQRDKTTWIAWLPIFAVVVVGCLLRLKVAATDLLWLDELHTGWAVQSDFAEMIQRSAQGNQAPLFFALTWSVVKALGASELTLRLVSLIAGGVVMIVASRVVFRWTSSVAAATVTTALIATDDTFIWYATEARPYALLHLLGLLQISFFIDYLLTLAERELEDDRGMKQHWSLAGLSIALLYTHYTSVFLLAVELILLLVAILALVHSGGRLRRSIPTELFAGFAAILLGACPLWFLMNLAFGRPDDWLLVSLPSQFLEQQGLNLLMWVLAPATAAVFVWVFSSTSKVKADTTFQQRKRRLPTVAFTLTGIFFLPAAFFLTLAQSNIVPIALSRYLSSSIVAGPLLAGIVIAMLRGNRRLVATMLLIIVTVAVQYASGRLIAQILSQRRVPSLRNEDWRSATQAINESVRKFNHPVLLYGAVIEDARAFRDRSAAYQAYLQFPLSSLYSVTEDSRFVFAGPTVNPPHFDAGIVDRVVKSGGAWIIVRHQHQHARSIANELLIKLHGRNVSAQEMSATELSPANGIVHLISIDIE